MLSTLVVTATLLLLLVQTARAGFFDDAQGPAFNLPPSIYQGPRPPIRIYRQDENVDLLCVASGSPPPTYEWFKDGNRLDVASSPQRFMFVTHGTLRILHATSLDEGYYQCSASNDHGVALSTVVHLRRAVLRYYQSSAVREYHVHEGDKLQMECKAPRSLPNATFSWSIAREVDTTPYRLTATRRMQINSNNGDLYFSYVKTTDANAEGYVYKCNVFNPFLDLTTTGSYSILHVIPNDVGGIPSSKPFVYFSSPSVVVAVERRSVVLRCFFSGHPEPAVRWRKDGRHIASSVHRYLYDNFHTELSISDVKPSDEATFTCHGTNQLDSAERTIFVDVQAAPEFRVTEDGPHDVNVTAGHSVTIHCRTYADPPADITWYQNGQPLNPDYLPRNFRLTSDRTTMTLRKICKQSADGAELDCSMETDTGPTVLQCNASNQHGYAFANGYINVLDPTVITKRPVDVELVPYVDVVFLCGAKTDPSTPLTRQWYYDNQPVANDDIMFVAKNGSLVVRLSQVDQGGIHLTGTYLCHVTNGYSAADAYARLLLHGAEPVTARSASFLSRYLLIGVILALLLLMIVILLLLCFLQRRRTATYRVDEKERKHGHDPEKDVDKERFLEYMKSVSHPSLYGSTLVPGQTVDDDAHSSDSENGTLVEEGRYNEDGSFIGQYSGPERFINVQNGRYYS